MRITRTITLVAPLLLFAATQASAQSSMREAIRRAAADAREFYQGRRGPEQNDTVSRKLKVGRDGRVSISNVSGYIVVSAGGGDEVSIEAVKRGRTDRGSLDRVQIVIEEHPGRVDIRTDYPPSWWRGDSNVSVDYTVVVPAGVSLEAHSVSGGVKVTGVKGALRLSSVSGNVSSADTPRLEYAKTVSGEIELAGIAHDDNVTINSISGNIQIAGLKARALDATTVSGDFHLRDAACERLTARSVSGNFEYAGTLARNGRYDVNSHSGSVRFTLADNTGFQLSAGSFSGSVRSDFPMTIGGDRNRDLRSRRGPSRESVESTFGDGGAALSVHTFSGNITIAKSTNK